MLEERLRNGHCLGTVATGELSDIQAERTGLVPTHAYAILNVKSVKVKPNNFLKKFCGQILYLFFIF